MYRSTVSRRQFTLLAGSLAASQVPMGAAPTVAASEFIAQVQKSLGGDWPATGVDGFKAGDPATPIRGIAVTAMATMSVLQQAAKANLNLIVTHEPTFYGRQDGPSPPPPAGARGRGPAGILPNDPIYKAKQDFIAKNGLVVFRLHDHWASRKENEMTTGLADALGWSKNKVAGEETMYDIPAATLEHTVASVRKKLSLRGGLRAVGDRKLRIRRVMLHPGVMPVATMWKNYDKVDLLLAGEVREWECTFYAADKQANGEKRSLVTIGRVASEEPGMMACATWLSSLDKNIPAKWISAGDPYWRAL
jgi:putative NIF3 family GTP cyclohydrolase 1 type 2